MTSSGVEIQQLWRQTTTGRTLLQAFPGVLQGTAEVIARQLNIAQVVAKAFPSEKGQIESMAGNGINEASIHAQTRDRARARARARVSIAMGMAPTYSWQFSTHLC